MKKYSVLSLALAVCLATASSSTADVYDDFEPYWYTDPGSGVTLPFRLFTPLDYEQNPDKEYPLIVNLHASGQSGTNNTSQLTYGVGQLLTKAKSDQYSAFMLAPQTDSGWSYYETPGNKAFMTTQVIDLLADYFRIDSRRVYLTGISLGGFGVWDNIGKRPNYFAAAVPICGGGDTYLAPNMVNQPIWAFHAADDNSVSVEYTREMIAAVQAAGGDPLYTEFPSGGHSIWGHAYNTSGLFDWMFSQILPIGNRPVTVENSYSLDEDIPLAVAPEEGILVNDSDLDGDPLTAIGYSDPSHGTLTLNADGSFDYTPDENYFGTDSFTYQAYDGNNYSRKTTVILDIAAINDAPVATTDAYSVVEGNRLLVYNYDGVLINDDDVETPDTISAVLDSNVSHGSLTFYENSGAFSYQPTSGFYGEDSFTYQAYDGEDYSEVATVLIQVLTALKAPGDANRDGRVDEADAATLAQYWGQNSADWSMGDFNEDGQVNAVDAAILAANWGYVANEAAAAVPEPSMMILLALALPAMLYSRAPGKSRRRG